MPPVYRVDIGTRWELFVDDYLIEALQGATLQLHHPIPQEVALPFDAPWEGNGSHYITMMAVDGEFRAYYRGSRPEGEGPSVTAVAVSSDGIHWHRPNLGLFEWNGSRENNIIWIGEASITFAPFLDSNPAAPPSQRFKAVADLKPGSSKRRGSGLVPFISEDGFHWQEMQSEPIITDGAFDSQNLVFWDAYRNEYVSFFRDFFLHPVTSEKIRGIKYAHSPDFFHWSEPVWLDYGDAPPEHFYTNGTVSYFRAPQIYMAFPKRFVPQRKAVAEHPHPGLSDGIFMTSRDGVYWDRRFMEAFLRPGRDKENWTERTNGIAWGMLQTAPDELSLHWIEHFRHPTARLRRGTLRLDGFASAYAGYSGGEVLTKPLVFQGNELVLNYATSAAGSVKVELQDAAGHPLPGYSLADQQEMYGDAIEEVVRWGDNTDLSQLSRQPVRLRLVLRDADVYALRFR